MENKFISVAIDGPAGAGKSSVAKSVAKRLGYVYIDTGAMYRAVALFAIRNGVDTRNSDGRLDDILDDIDIEIKYIDSSQHVFLNGEDVSGLIRTPEISMGASNVATVKSVRKKLVSLQRLMAKKANVIMDGRDICTSVLPNAQVKIFLTADSEKRAKRRYDELILKGESVNFEDVLADVKARDKNDSKRKESPLKIAQTATVIDNGDMTLSQTEEYIYNFIKKSIR